MADFPAMPVFTDAYMRDCWHLSDAEHGRYFMLLILIWQSPQCRIPNDPDWIARRLRKTREEYDMQVHPLVQEFCITDGNWIRQKRLSKEYNYVAKLSKKRSDAAKSRWDKDKIPSKTDAEHVDLQAVSNAPTPTPTPTPTIKVVDTPIPPKPEPLELIPARADDALRSTVERVIKSWNMLAAETKIPTVQRLSDARTKKLLARLKDIGGIEGWHSLVDKIRNSRYLCGEAGRDWCVSFDWVLIEGNLTKIMEGNYDDKQRTAAPGKPSPFADAIYPERSGFQKRQRDP